MSICRASFVLKRVTPSRILTFPVPRAMSTTKPVSTSNKEGLGLLVPASKIHTSFKTELLNTLASPEFTTGQKFEGREGREPKLVGILATKKEDAKFYSEVGAMLA